KTIPDKSQPLILYCNGLFCGRSERLADDLTKLGYRNVRRYQLGAPGWRALGGVMQVEKPALLRLLAQDATSVLIDGRGKAGLKPRLHNAVSIPLPEASQAKDDGRLPMTDHNTRIFVVGTNGAEARAVAEAIVHDAFHNVTFFAGAITDLSELLEDEEGYGWSRSVQPAFASILMILANRVGSVRALDGGGSPRADSASVATLSHPFSGPYGS